MACAFAQIYFHKKKTSTKVEQDEGAKTPAEPDVKSESSVWPICDTVIVDVGETVVGEDAIYCEGQCKQWYHCCCADLTKHKFLKQRTRHSLSFPLLHCTRSGRNH